MIVISDRLVLNDVVPDTSFNADNPLVGWHNILVASDITADSESANFPAINMATESTYERWISNTTADQNITLLPNSDQDVDYLGIARHNFGTQQIAFSLEARAEASDPWTELVTPRLVVDDRPLILVFASQPISEMRLRMWQGNAAPSIAVLYLGRILTLQRRVYVGHTPIVYGRDTQTVNGVSESGNFLGRIVTGETRVSSVELANLTPTWYRQHMDPFIAAAQTTPFFFAWRPGTYPNETGFAWLTDQPRPTNQLPNGMMRISMSMRGIA